MNEEERDAERNNFQHIVYDDRYISYLDFIYIYVTYVDDKHHNILQIGL